MPRIKNLQILLIVTGTMVAMGVVTCSHGVSPSDRTPVSPLDSSTVHPSLPPTTLFPTSTSLAPTPMVVRTPDTISPTIQPSRNTPVPSPPAITWTLALTNTIPRNVIAFVSDKHASRTNLDIWLLNPNGSHLQLLPTWLCVPNDGHRAELQPTWSPDGRKLAMISAKTRNGENALICVFDFGTGNTIVFSETEKIYAFSWAPDSNQIVYSSPQGLWITSLKHPDHQSLLYEMPGTPVSWAPDGLKIGFGQGKQQSDDFTGLQIIGLNGSLFEAGEWERPLGAGAGIVQDITWSPSGRRVTVSYRASRWGGHLALFEIRDRRFVFKRAIHNFFDYPLGKDYCCSRWSPDGTQIVFIEGEPLVDSQCAGTLHLADAALSSDTVLFPEGTSLMSACWAPDGRHILFEKGREIKNREGRIASISFPDSIWIVNSDGTNPRQLIGGDGHYYGEPVWQPPVQTQ